MPAEGNVIERLAESVSDGAAIDWDHIDSTRPNERERGFARNLRVVSEIARWHWHEISPGADPTQRHGR